MFCFGIKKVFVGKVILNFFGIFCSLKEVIFHKMKIWYLFWAYCCKMQRKMFVYSLKLNFELFWNFFCFKRNFLLSYQLLLCLLIEVKFCTVLEFFVFIFLFFCFKRNFCYHLRHSPPVSTFLQNMKALTCIDLVQAEKPEVSSR